MNAPVKTPVRRRTRKHPVQRGPAPRTSRTALTVKRPTQSAGRVAQPVVKPVGKVTEKGAVPRRRQRIVERRMPENTQTIPVATTHGAARRSRSSPPRSRAKVGMERRKNYSRFERQPLAMPADLIQLLSFPPSYECRNPNHVDCHQQSKARVRYASAGPRIRAERRRDSADQQQRDYRRMDGGPRDGGPRDGRPRDGRRDNRRRDDVHMEPTPQRGHPNSRRQKPMPQKLTRQTSMHKNSPRLTRQNTKN